MANKATPPTTPPAIFPVLLDDELDEDDDVEVAAELETVQYAFGHWEQSRGIEIAQDSFAEQTGHEGEPSSHSTQSARAKREWNIAEYQS